MKRCVFIGDKLIGLYCLRAMLNSNIEPKMIVLDQASRDRYLFQEFITRIPSTSCPKTLGEVASGIKACEPEVIFHVGGLRIVPPEILAIPRLGVLNLHPSLLPKHRGRYSIPHAIFEGDVTTGATLHWMDAGIDTGPIVMQKEFPIGDTDTAGDVWHKFNAAGAKLFSELLDLWMLGNIPNARPQMEDVASYHRKALPNNGVLDWSWDGAKILRFIRAMTCPPYPPPAFMLGNSKMIIADKDRLPIQHVRGQSEVP